MKKIQLLSILFILAIPALAQNTNDKADNSFKIVSLVFLIAALVLAIWKLKGTYKK